MTDPDDLVEVEVPSEHLREGDTLVIDTVEHHVDRFIPDAVPEFVYAFVPEQLPIPRGVLVRVRRPRSQTTLAPTPDPIAEQLAEVRDLALALAEQAGKDNATGTAASRARVAERADRVRARLEQETTTDGTAGPDAPVQRQSEPVQLPADAPAAVAGPPEPAPAPVDAPAAAAGPAAVVAPGRSGAAKDRR